MSANQVAFIASSGGPRHPNPDDLVLYAMQLLAVEEAATVSHHLESCAECRAELARTHADLAAYALTAEPENPPALSRQRLIQQVAREKKVITIAQPAPATAQTAPPIAAFGRSGPILASEVRRPSQAIGRSVLAWSGWAVAAGLAVALGFLYGDRSAMRETLTSQYGQILRLNTAAATSHQLMDALTDPRAVRVTLTTKPLPKRGPMGGVTYNPAKGSLVFLASELDPLQVYKTYELWIIPADGTAPVPAGTFHPDDQGNASVVMPDLPKDVAAKAFGVTIENDGGTQTPTMPLIMAGS
jgi:anti-sigma-K factor RskA